MPAYNIAKQANFVNNGTLELKSDLFEGGEDDEYNSVELVEISIIFVSQDDFTYGAASFDEV